MRSEQLSAITSLSSSAEYLYNLARNRRDLGEADELKPGSPEASVRAAGVLGFLARRRVRMVAYAVRGTASVALLVLPGRFRVLRGLAGAVSGTLGAVYAPLQRFGSDGADQATVVAQGSNAIARFGGDGATEVTQVFQAAQVTMSYGIAGWAKLLGEPWRDGTAVRDILRTKSYGHKKLWQFLRDRPRLSKLVTWGVVAWESVFPVVLFLPRWAAKGMAASGLLFHIANGPAMGLWRFIFAFASLHPALHRVIDRDVPMSTVTRITALSGAMLATAWTRSALQGRRRAREVDSHYAGLEQVRTRRATAVPVDVTEGRDDAPIAVLEGGLLAMSEQFHWIAQALSAAGWTVVRTTRADYVSPTNDGSPESLALKADDLADVVTHASERRPGRRVVIVGHSLGAEIARQAAIQCSEVDVVLLDPTHPNQFIESTVQAGTRSRFTEQLVLFQYLLNAGFGSYLTLPESMASLPVELRDRAMMKYSDSRLWNAGRREWKTVLSEFGQRRDIPEPSSASLVISAGRTVEADHALRRLHESLASARHVVIEDVTHESLLSNATHAQRCADIILEWSDARA